MNDKLPLPAEHLIRGALEKLRASRNHFKSKLVSNARELLELCLREHGHLPIQHRQEPHHERPPKTDPPGRDPR